MTTRLLQIHTPTPTTSLAEHTRADLGFSALPFLAKLRDALVSAGRLIAADRKANSKSGAPPLFFFDRDASLQLVNDPKRLATDWRERVQRNQAEAPIWQRLIDLLDDALTLLPASVTIRRAARATDGLRAAAADVAGVVKSARSLIELLDVPDDQVVLAIHPMARVGVRVMIRGVAEMNQLHVLLADLMTGDSARGLLPGRRPDPRLIAAYLDSDPEPDAGVATARFQMYRPSALRADGTLPRGFAGSDYWIWGDRSTAVLPTENGERVVLLGDPVYAAEWDVGRKFAGMTAEAERTEVLSRSEVEAWLTARCPSFRSTVASRQAA